MNTPRILTLAILATGLIAAIATGEHCSQPCCPDCGHKMSVPEAATIKTKKFHCEVECKDVCIPAVKNPFNRSCGPACYGRVRTVKVLKKIEYECEQRGYKWQVLDACACGQ